MTARVFAIEPFAAIPGEVEVVGLGRIRRPRGGALEAEVEVVLADGVGTRSRIPEDRIHHVWIGCGQMDLVSTGTRWRGGMPVDRQPPELHTAMIRLAGSGREPLGEGANPPVGRGLGTMPTGRIADAPCFRVALASSPGAPGAPAGIAVIPQIELVRAVFGVSSGMIRQLVDGARDPALAHGRRLFDVRGSRVRRDGSVELRADRRLTRREAVMAAAIVAAPRIRRFHDAVFQGLSVTPSWRSSEWAWINVDWPFAEPLACTFEGRWFERASGGRRFLVTRLTKLALPLGFDTVEVLHPGGERAQPALRLPPDTSRRRSGPAGIVRLLTGPGPSQFWRPTSIASPDIDVGASSVGVVHVPTGGPTGPRTPDLRGDPGDATGHSTGGAGGDADRAVRPAEAGRTRQAATLERSRTDALRLTWDALEDLAGRRKWSLRSHVMTEGGGVVAASGPDPAGGPLVAVLTTDSGQVVVSDHGSSSGGERSLGLLFPDDGRAGPDVVAAVVARTLNNLGRWRGKNALVPGCETLAVIRPSNLWKSRDEYADFIGRHIDEAQAWSE